jgi:hypothetical protein
MTHIPMITSNDMKRAFELFSEPVGNARGKMTKRVSSQAIYIYIYIYDNDLVLDEIGRSSK